MRARANFWILAGFVALAALFGGASRADVSSQVVGRLAAILLIASAALQMSVQEWRRVRLPVLFLIAVAAIIALQLLPLPPALWDQLPGRELYREALGAAGVAPVWRPISLTPDLTLNALLSVLPPLAAVLGLAVIDRKLHPDLVPILLVLAALSAVIGIVQVSAGSLYLYEVTNNGSLVGFFANRNHEALFLAAALPLLAMWASDPALDPGRSLLRGWLALCFGGALIPILLVTGSRAGLALASLAAAAALAIYILQRSHRRSVSAWAWALAALPILIGVIAAGLARYLERDEALRRLIGGQEGEIRTENLPIFLRMIGEYFPFGSGFGSFDAVYRMHEPHEALRFTYLNHAHNDLAEILIEGGVLPVLLVVAFLAWFAYRSWSVWKVRATGSQALLSRVSVVIVLLALASSLVDYPLRTPFWAILFALACCWLLPLDAADPKKALPRQGDSIDSGGLTESQSG